jgi:GNAT superfamily N-acetyltransferase
MTDETGELVPFGREHLGETVELFAAEGWETYTEDAERTFRALTASGSTTIVAIAEGAVAGVIQIQSDGEIEATIALLLIGAQWRGRGFGRSLIRVAFERAGGMRLGVLTQSGDYYEALGAAAVPGFRLRPEDLGGA